MSDGTTHSIAYGTAVQVASPRLDILLTEAPNACPSAWFTESQNTPTDVNAIWIDMWRPSNGSYVGSFGLDDSTTYGDNPGRVAITTLQVPAGSTFALNSTKFRPVAGAFNITEMDTTHVVGSIHGNFEDGTSLDMEFDVPFCTAACTP